MPVQSIDFSAIQPYLIAGAVGAALAAALLFIKRIVWSRFIRWARTTSRPWDEILLDQLRPPINALLLIVSLSFAFQMTPDPMRAHPAITAGSKTLLILALLWLVNRALTVTMQFWKPIKAMGDSTRVLILTVSRAVLVLLTGLIVLETVGISITPLLASLGVGSVAVALALQDTLSNFFSGIYILLDEPIRVGDFIRFEGTLEGTVRKIGWRSTHVQTASNMIVIPNSKLSSSIVTNLNMPDEEVEVVIPFGVAYGSDLDKVERVTLGVAKEVLKKTPGAVADFEPFLRFKAFGDSSIDLTVFLRAKSFPEQAFLIHQFMKALDARFRAEQISIPFPQRVIHFPEKGAPLNA